MILKVGDRVVHCCKEQNDLGGQSYFLCAHNGDVDSMASFSLVGQTLKVDGTDLFLRKAVPDTLAIFTETEKNIATIEMVRVNQEGAFVIVSNNHVLEQETDLYHFSWQPDRQNNGAVFTIAEAPVRTAKASVRTAEAPVRTEIIDVKEEDVDVTDLEQEFAKLEDGFKRLTEMIQRGEVKPDFLSDDDLTE